MADVSYDRFVEAALEGAANTDLTAGNLHFYAVASGYTFSTTHEFLSSISAPDRLSVSPNAATGVGVGPNGLLDCNDLTGADALPDPGAAYVAIVCVLRAAASENAAADRLVSFHDTFTPTPVGAPIELTFPSGIVQF